MFAGYWAKCRHASVYPFYFQAKSQGVIKAWLSNTQPPEETKLLTQFTAFERGIPTRHVKTKVLLISKVMSYSTKQRLCNLIKLF